VIFDSLQNASLYTALLPGLEEAMEWLGRFDPAAPDGRYPIDGERIFALVQRYETGPSTEKRFEAHRRHVDVQFVAAGAERILHTPLSGLEVDEPYSEESDVVFFRDPPFSSSILVRAGEFAIFAPGDAHKPGCMAGGRDAVCKVVVKIRIP
jgi:YhcH/YjgK/YiaL family protein